MIYAPISRGHLRAIEAKYDAVMHTTIAERLSYEPDVQIRTRKPLKRPIFSAATWELRFGARNRFRVFYDIDQKEHGVAVLAIGIKGSNRLLIGGEEMRL
jgi:hypothetical protein